MKRAILCLLLPLALLSCKDKEFIVTYAEGNQININDSINQNDSINNFIEPYKNRINEEMNTVLAYSQYNLSKTDSRYNTAIGNMMADAVMELSNSVFKSRTKNSIDVVLLNHGGIRSTINQGDITTRTAYQVMPFENEIIVTELEGAQIFEMIHYLATAKTAHPISGLQLILNENGEVQQALIQGKPIEIDKTYFVATSDYLMNGGDNMNFFQKRKTQYALDYKIRNLLIDYFTKKDTIAPVRDQRFIVQ